MSEEHKKHHPLFEKSHKIGILVFLLFFVLGIPLTVVAAKNSPYLNSTGVEVAGNTLQMEAFNPTISGLRAKLPHVDGQALVRYTNAVTIKTTGGNTSPFTPDDIISGLPPTYLQSLKSIPVSSIERIGPAVVSGATEANKYIANTYLVSFPTDKDLTKVLDTLCSDGSITMYCEPNYKFSIVQAFSPDVIQTQSPSGLKNITFGIVGAPLPSDYSSIASSLNLPMISQNQIMPDTEEGSSSNSLETASYIHAALPDSKFLYAGACGSDCAISSISHGIIFSVDKGANMVYLSERAPFPQGIEPYSLKSAIYYALTKKVGVIAATRLEEDQQANSQSFIKKIFSYIVRPVFAGCPSGSSQFGTYSIKSPEQNISEKIGMQPGNGYSLCLEDEPSNTKGVEKDTFTPPSELAALYAAKSLLETGDVPAGQKDALAAYNANTTLPSNIADINKRIAQLEGGAEGGQPKCSGLCSLVKKAQEKADEAEKNQPPAPEGSTDNAPVTPLGTKAGSGPTTNKTGGGGGTQTGGGGATAPAPAAPVAPPAPVYNLPPSYQAGQKAPVGFNPAYYGGYNPVGAPLLGVGYGALCPNGQCTPGSQYSATPGTIPGGQQYTVPGSAYGPGYGYATMQYTAQGVWQQTGFGYGNISPNSPQILSGDSTPIGQQSSQGGTRTQGGYIFGGDGQL